MQKKPEHLSGIKYIFPVLIVEILIIFVLYISSGKQELMSVELTGARLDEEAEFTRLLLKDNEVLADNPGNVDYEQPEKIIYNSEGLFKGSYDITIYYEAEADNNFFTLRSNNYNDLDADFGEDLRGWLPSVSGIHTSHISSARNSTPLYLTIYYAGNGKLTIEKVIATQTNAGRYRRPVIAGLLFLCLDILLLKRKWLAEIFSVKQYSYTVGLLLLIFIASLPVFARGIYIGHDTLFHVMRIEGLKEAILSGQFPPKMHSTHMYGYGYATGQMYPQLFLYPSAIMRILGFDRVCAHDFLIFMINALTVCISYYSFLKIFKVRHVAFIGTVLYTLAPYRMLDIYFRDAVGEYCAMTGLPLVIWGIYSFIKREETEESPCYIALALGFTIVLESHLLTTLTVAVFSILLGLIFIKRLLRRDCLIGLGKFAALTLLLNAGFLVPLLDYMRLPMNHFSNSIKNKGLDIALLFTNNMLHASADLKGRTVVEETGQIGIDDKLPFAIGYALLFTTAAFLLFVRMEDKYRLLGVTALAFGVLNCVLSLYIFPWEILERTILGGVIAAFQFPWRFLIFVPVSLTVCGCIGVIYLTKRTSVMNVMLIVGLTALFGFINMTDFLIEKVGLSADVKLDYTYLGAAREYLLEGTDGDLFEKRGERISTSSENVRISDYVKLGSRLTLKASNSDDVVQLMDLPLTMYPGYCAKDSHGGSLDVTYGDNQVVRVLLPPGFDDTVYVCFGGKWYWKAAAVISLLTGAGIILFFNGLKKFKEL
ncbi:MAG: hypothetical protein J6O71_03430 [Lachnospiraceae bacterium]|nr:hypothetical protein [Lachnospiraceae bacterium]